MQRLVTCRFRVLRASGSARPLFWLLLLLMGVVPPAAVLLFAIIIRWAWRGVTTPTR